MGQELLLFMINLSMPLDLKKITLQLILIKCEDWNAKNNKYTYFEKYQTLLST